MSSNINSRFEHCFTRFHKANEIYPDPPPQSEEMADLDDEIQVDAAQQEPPTELPKPPDPDRVPIDTPPEAPVPDSPKPEIPKPQPPEPELPNPKPDRFSNEASRVNDPVD